MSPTDDNFKKPASATPESARSEGRSTEEAIKKKSWSWDRLRGSYPVPDAKLDAGQLAEVVTALGERGARHSEQADAAGSGKKVQSQLLSMRQAAKLLGVSRNRRLRDLIESGQLNTVALGTRRRVPRAEIERLIEEGTDGPPRTPRRRAASPGQPSRRRKKGRETPGDRIRRLKI